MGPALDAEVSDRLAGKEPATAWPVFATQDHATATYVRNSGCWLADVDLTGVSPWNSQFGAQRAGTAISPRHILYAVHFALAFGTLVRFVATDGTVIERTLVDDTPVGATDLLVGTLDMALPASIAPVRLMPPEAFAKYRIPPEAGCRVAIIDQQERALVARISGTFSTTVTWQAEPEWGSALVGGDSGSPILAVLNGQLVLWTVASGSQGGWSVPTFADAIRAIVQADGEDVTFTDLSGFPDVY